MKAIAWQLALGLAAAVSTTPCCDASFLWIRAIDYECDPPQLTGYKTYRFYAQFSNPGDRLLAVFGSAAHPLSISGTAPLYQHPLGGNTAPSSNLIAQSPAVAWDTFCTIGLAKNINGADHTTTTPGFPQLPMVNNTTAAWSADPATTEQGAPDAAGLVLIAQVTCPPGSFIAQFKVNIQYQPAGTNDAITVNNQSFVLSSPPAGDVNGNFQVNAADLLAILNTWGSTGQGIGDPNDDGIVNVEDVLMVIKNWGLFPGNCP